GISSDSAATLPDGLTLAANTGTISGTPTGSAGTYNVTFKVVDKQGNSSKKVLPVVVQDAALSITSTLPLAPGSLATPYTQQLNASGGRGSYMWSLASGS